MQCCLQERYALQQRQLESLLAGHCVEPVMPGEPIDPKAAAFFAEVQQELQEGQQVRMQHVHPSFIMTLECCNVL